MSTSAIKSKPVYGRLQADARGRHHLFVGTTHGEAALARVIDDLVRQPGPPLLSVRLLLAGSSADATDATAGAPGAQSSPDARDPLAGLAAARPTRMFETQGALLAALETELHESLMGTRLYVAGPESFIGLVIRLALRFDLNKDEIHAEPQGPTSRRVYCIHCRSTAAQVETNIVRCEGCDRWLLVRDHYSRRLAAYMGVMVDAEVPGARPAVEKVFP